MLGLNETIDQLAMESSVHWYGHVMRRKDGHGLRKASYFEAKSQMMKWKPKWTWKVDEESIKVGLKMEEI